MFNKNDDCIIPLMQYLREHSPETLTSVNIFINSEEMVVTTTSASADDLKIRGCSMRNLRGDWIRDKEIKLNPDGSQKE